MGLQKSVEKTAKRKGFKRCCWHIYYWQLQKSWCCCQDVKWNFRNRQISVYTTTTLAFGKGLWRSAIINKQCFEKHAIPDVLGLSFGLRFLYLEEGRKSIRHLCLCLSVSVCVSLSLFWCSYVILRKWEIGRQIVVAREDLHPTALQNPNKRWLHAGPRCCVTSQALEVRLLPLFCFFFLVLFPYPAFVIIRPTYIQSSTMWRNLKVLGTRRFGIRVQKFLGWWWWWRWLLPSSETPNRLLLRLLGFWGLTVSEIMSKTPFEEEDKDLMVNTSLWWV